MKIVVAGIYPPDTGGPATYAVALERELPKLGIEVSVVPFGSVRHLPKVVRHVAYSWRLFTEVRGADALFVQDAVSSGLPALVAAKVARKPIVVRIGGDFAWEQAIQRFGVTDSIDDFQSRRYGLRVELLRMIQTFVVRHANAVIAPSKYLGEIVSGWMNHGKVAEVVYNGVELPVTVTKPQERPEGVLIATVGRMVPWKGFDEFIEAVAKEESWRLVIVGDGPDMNRLEDIAKDLGCSERVHFTGALPRDEVLGWCSVADVFALNSSYEGLSHVLIEVQSIGTPVVASDIPGNAEVISSGENGLLVPLHSTKALHDAIKDILENPEQAAAYAKKAQHSVQSFSISNTMQRVADILKAL